MVDDESAKLVENTLFEAGRDSDSTAAEAQEEASGPV
jgi:hypothetical protein